MTLRNSAGPPCSGTTSNRWLSLCSTLTCCPYPKSSFRGCSILLKMYTPIRTLWQKLMHWLDSQDIPLIRYSSLTLCMSTRRLRPVPAYWFVTRLGKYCMEGILIFRCGIYSLIYSFMFSFIEEEKRYSTRILLLVVYLHLLGQSLEHLV